MKADRMLGGALTRVVTVIVTRCRRVVVVALLVAIGSAVLGGPVAGLMSSAVGDPHAADVVANDRLARAAGVDPGADAIVLVRPGRSVTHGTGAQDVTAARTRLARIPGVARVEAPTGSSGGQPGANAELVSRDGRQAVIIAHYRPSADADAVSKRILAAFAHQPHVLLGGSAIATTVIDHTVSSDLSRSEIVVFPLLLLLALWIFRGLIAAVVPLVCGAVAIVACLLCLRAVNAVAPLSTYVLDLVIGMGLGLSIDYSLFVISRYREEAATGGYTTETLIRATVRSGRTVLFSAATVAAALASLLVFPQRFLYSMGVGGVLVVVLAALTSLLVLPAILAVLGPRIDGLAPRRWRQTGRRQSPDPTRSAWYRIGKGAMRRPVLTLAGTIVILGVAASPVLHLRLSDVDPTALPAAAPAHQVSTALANEFPALRGSPLQVAVSAGPGAATRVERVAGALRRLGGTAVVSPPRYLGDRTWEIDLTTRDGPYTAASTELVHQIGDLRLGGLGLRGPLLVTGDAAQFANLKSSMVAHLPAALLIVVLAVLIVVFCLTRSVLLPIKTLLVNGLTVAAVLGILVWIFQEGHLSGVFGFTSTGFLDLTQPVLVVVIAFGLSTDYGVFLLARIKESHDHNGHNVEAVAQGLGRTGRIISSAALLLAVAIGAFSTSSILFIKELGVGAAVAVLLDATIVRALLVPSAMRLAGHANWWRPDPTRTAAVVGRWTPAVIGGAAAAAATVVIGSGAVLGQPVTWTAQASLGVVPAPAAPNTADRVVPTTLRIFEIPGFLAAAARPSHTAPAAVAASSIHARPVPGTSLLTVTVRASDPAVAATLLTDAVTEGRQSLGRVLAPYDLTVATAAPAPTRHGGGSGSPEGWALLVVVAALFGAGGATVAYWIGRAHRRRMALQAVPPAEFVPPIVPVVQVAPVESVAPVVPAPPGRSGRRVKPVAPQTRAELPAEPLFCPWPAPPQEAGLPGS